MRSIGIPELIVLFCAFTVAVVPFVFYLISLERALQRCSPAARTMPPGQVWLLFIPLFNVYWDFIVVSRIASSLRNEYHARGIAMADEEPGKAVGLAMCILTLCSIIPILGIFTGMASFVCWIVYWVRIAEYSRRLGPAPAAAIAI